MRTCAQATLEIISDDENFITTPGGALAAARRRSTMHARSLSHEALGAWLALSAVRGLPPAVLRELVCAFGDARTLLAQPLNTVAERAGFEAAHAVAAAAQVDVGEQLERTRAWCETPGHAILALDDPAYPAALLTMHDPPPLLYVRGRLEALHAPGIAIVGSRNATPQGMDDARRFARELAAAGFVVVSGLALGIDAAAHRGALEGGGETVAVVGTGADVVYPAQHVALARDIVLRGAIISEWPPGTPARPAHFPQRNRLIAGMSAGVLVVEAAQRSGSLITARLANEMGRDVFAIPGSIHAPLARGCHGLIKDGAKLTESPDDILEELKPVRAAFTASVSSRPRSAAEIEGVEAPSRVDAPAARVASSPRKPSRVRADGASTRSEAKGTQPMAPPAALPLFDEAGAPSSQNVALSSAGDRLLTALGHAPAALEVLAARTEMDSARLQAALLELELRGLLTVLPGGRYVRHTRS